MGEPDPLQRRIGARPCGAFHAAEKPPKRAGQPLGGHDVVAHAQMRKDGVPLKHDAPRPVGFSP